MPSAFDELLQEAEDAGVDPQWIDRMKSASSGSPLRKERDEAKAALEKAINDANRYRTAALTGAFQQLGVKVKPDALNIPPDLDPLDNDAVSAWAVGMGLAGPPPPPLTPEDQRGHQQLADASAGAEPPPRHDARAEILAAKTEEEFWAKARAAGMTAS